MAIRLDDRINPQTITKDIFDAENVLEHQQAEIKELKNTSTYSPAELSQITKIAIDIVCIIRVSTENREYLANALKNSLEGKVTFSNTLSFPMSSDIAPRRPVSDKQEDEKRKAFLIEEDDKRKVGSQLTTLCSASCHLERTIDRTFKKLVACYDMFEKHDPDNDALSRPSYDLSRVKYHLENMKKVSLERFVLFRPSIRQPFPSLLPKIDFEALEHEVAAEKERKGAFDPTLPYGPAKMKLFRTPEEIAEYTKAEEAKALAAELEAKKLAEELAPLTLTEDLQPVEAPMQQVKLEFDPGWGNSMGICCESLDWDKNPITLSNEGLRWFGEVSVGVEWKYVILNYEGQVIKWETVQSKTGNRNIPTLQEAAFDHSAEVQF